MTQVPAPPAQQVRELTETRQLPVRFLLVGCSAPSYATKILYPASLFLHIVDSDSAGEFGLWVVAENVEFADDQFVAFWPSVETASLAVLAVGLLCRRGMWASLDEYAVGDRQSASHPSPPDALWPRSTAGTTVEPES